MRNSLGLLPGIPRIVGVHFSEKSGLRTIRAAQLDLWAAAVEPLIKARQIGHVTGLWRGLFSCRQLVRGAVADPSG